MVGLGVGQEEVVTAVKGLFFVGDGDGGEVVWWVGVFGAEFYGFVECEPMLDTTIRIMLLWKLSISSWEGLQGSRELQYKRFGRPLAYFEYELGIRNIIRYDLRT